MAKLPAYEDWKRPWAEGELDEDRAAKLIYNALQKAEQAGDKLATKLTEKDEEIERLTTEIDTVKAGKSSTDEETKDELKALRSQVRDLTAKTSAPRPEDQKQIDRLNVAIELGLSKRDANRLVGETYDELLEDAKAFAEEHGIDLSGDDGGSNGNEGAPSSQGFQLPTERPVGTLRTGFDPKTAKTASQPATAAELLKQVPLS